MIGRLKLNGCGSLTVTMEMCYIRLVLQKSLTETGLTIPFKYLKYCVNLKKIIFAQQLYICTHICIFQVQFASAAAVLSS